MAVLDDRFERARERLREELELFRLANDRFTEALGGKAKPAITKGVVSIRQGSFFVRTVRGLLTRWRDFWTRKDRNADNTSTTDFR